MTQPNEIHLVRVNRMVLVTGPNRTAVDPKVETWLEEKLTYYEKKFDFAASTESGNRFSYVERPLHCRHPSLGFIAFPLGLRARIASGLREEGHTVKYIGSPVLDPASPEAQLDWDGLLTDFKIFPGQDVCLSRLIAADGGVVAATTGSGKSVIIRMMCRLYPKAKIHIVTKSADLAREIYDDVSTVIPSVGFVGSGKKSIKRVTVFVADSMHHGMGDCSILLADEVHELAAPSYAQMLGRYTKCKMFGFSATPKGRQDGRDVEIEAIFGPVLYDMPYQEAQSCGRVVPITVEWLRVTEGPNVSGITSIPVREQLGIWRNDLRNRMIAERVNQFEPDEQVMVMVKTIEHAVRLKALMPEFTLVYAAKGMDRNRSLGYAKQGLLPANEPEMTHERLRELKKQFASGKLKKVISNYVWSTGVNFPHLGVLVRADAASSELKAGQIPGRICRRVPGVKESAVLVDVWDVWDHSFLERSRSRRSSYTQRGWVHVFWDQPETQAVQSVQVH